MACGWSGVELPTIMFVRLLVYTAPDQPLNIEPEVNHVAVFDRIFTSLDVEQSLLLYRSFRSETIKVGELHDFSADKAALEIGVNRSRCMRSKCAPFHCPCMHLFRPGREERHEMQQVVAPPNDLIKSRLFESQSFEEGVMLAFGELSHFGLHRG